jgi:hypothetical protein
MIIRRKSVLSFWKAVYRLREADFHLLHAADPDHLKEMVGNITPPDWRALRLWLRIQERR